MAFDNDLGDYTGKIVGVVVAVIVVLLVAVPIINNAAQGIEDATLKTIINVIPTFLVISILLAVVGMFLKDRLF